MRDVSSHAQATSARGAARHALLTGGGSGGHVFPALAVADALRQRGWQVSYAGARTGIEARLAQEHGIPFHALPARPVVGQGMVGKARALLTLGGSALRARGLVRRTGTSVVIGTGGYGAAPAIVGGRLAGRPTLLVEPNAQAGVANRALSRVASAAAIAYPQTADQLHCPTTVTGVPVRAGFFEIADQVAPRPPVRILVLGGSQGAEQLNALVPAALALLGDAAQTLSIHHQCGPRHAERTAARYAEAGWDPAHLQLEPFITDMSAAMQACHLAVSRAGAMTLSELCAAGRPSVLVPLGAAGGHQLDNARALEAVGASRVLTNADARPDRLASLLEALVLGSDAAVDTQLTAMAAAARSVAPPDAAAAIADQAETLARGDG